MVFEIELINFRLWVYSCLVFGGMIVCSTVEICFHVYIWKKSTDLFIGNLYCNGKMISTSFSSWQKLLFLRCCCKLVLFALYFMLFLCVSLCGFEVPCLFSYVLLNNVLCEYFLYFQWPSITPIYFSGFLLDLTVACYITSVCRQLPFHGHFVLQLQIGVVGVSGSFSVVFLWTVGYFQCSYIYVL